MKWIKYSRYTGEDFGVDADDLLKALSDFLLQSGFQNPYMPGGEWDEHTLENLKHLDGPQFLHGCRLRAPNLRR